MAFVILYTIRDAKGESSTTEVNLPDATTLANVVDFAGDMALLINAITTGQIVRIGVALIIDLPVGLRVAPGVNSDVEEGARFQFRTANNFLTSLRIPTFNEALVEPASRQVDTSDTAVAAFTAAMITGLPGGAPCDKREEDIVSLDSALEQFVSSR